MNYGTRPVGSLVGGAAGTLLGLRPTLWIATIGGLAGFLWLLPSPLPPAFPDAGGRSRGRRAQGGRDGRPGT